MENVFLGILCAVRRPQLNTAKSETFAERLRSMHNTQSRGVNSATVYVNHPKSVCGYCSGNLKKRLVNGKTIILKAPNATPPNGWWKTEATIIGQA